jgi:hypothetical protein
LADRIVFEDLSGRGKVLAIVAKHYGANKPANFFVASPPVTVTGTQMLEKLWTPSKALEQATQTFTPAERTKIKNK